MATETIATTHSPTMTITGDTTALPQQLPFNVDSLPKLTAEQAGHLRHFHNLTSQKDGCWNHMDSEDPGQELFDAYRYQLATMAYATSVAHYHRLPALRGPFRGMMQRIIHKMLRREVWQYWFNTSVGGTLLDPSLKELRKPWADPIVRENIMYSGHLLLMTSLYGMLFDDDKYEKPGSIVFDWNPAFWGFGAEEYTYSTSTIQECIIDEMEKHNWLGVCCEPNAIFVICNQFPLIAIRYNDVRNKTNLIDGILERYRAAWADKGLISPEGLFTAFWMVKQDHTVQSHNVAAQAWTGAFMNAWNSDFIYANFERQLQGFVTTIDGQVRLHTSSVGNRIRTLTGTHPEEHDYNSAKTLAAAIQLHKEQGPIPNIGREKLPSLGYLTQWFSELGKEDLLKGILDYADKSLEPTWDKGGLFYPRNDTLVKDNGGDDWIFVDPYTGNAAIGYGRLNVKDGQKKMYENPWTSEYLATRPYVDNIDYAENVDFLRGTWEEESSALVVTLKAWDGEVHHLEPRINNLSPGEYGVYLRGRLQHIQKIDAGQTSFSMKINLESGEGAVDLVVLRA